MLGARSKLLAMTTYRAATQSRAVFIASSAIIYSVTIIVATLTLNAYFAQTWDVRTFIQAAHRFLDGGNPFDLYAQSRAAQTWPYAYPPLHAFVTAVFLWIGKLVPIAPDYVWARFPALIADICIGIALYAIVERKSSDESLARLAMLLWLFNPVTFYDTAVQGHFESEWILFVLLAYALFENSRGFVLPTIVLAVAVLFKQVAILFVVPVWVFMVKAEVGRQKANFSHPSSFILHPLSRIAASILLFAIVTIGVSLPYLLYSDDFLYMNLTYLENVPVQTQSWLVGVLALTRPARDAMTSDFFLFRYQTIATMLAAIAISVFAVRREFSLYLTAVLIAILFFLTSRKVMGYYYVMLFPFLFAEVLPRRRFGLALFAILLTAWISLSPYYAPWVNPDHIWIYAILGAINSALFVGMFAGILSHLPLRAAQGLRGSGTTEAISEIASHTCPGARCQGKKLAMTYPLLFVSLCLFAAAALAAFLQPLAPDGGSPIRAPIIVPGAETTVLAAFGALVGLLLIGMWTLSRKMGNVPREAWGIVLIFAPLFFVVYYLTKESTAVLELVLKALGV